MTGVSAAVRAELAALVNVPEVTAAVALDLAAVLDDPDTAPRDRATAARELRATMAEAREAGVPTGDVDPVEAARTRLAAVTPLLASRDERPGGQPGREKA